MQHKFSELSFISNNKRMLTCINCRKYMLATRGYPYPWIMVIYPGEETREQNVVSNIENLMKVTFDITPCISAHDLADKIANGT